MSYIIINIQKGLKANVIMISEIVQLFFNLSILLFCFSVKLFIFLSYG